VVLYEMLTGCLPFRATDFSELSRKVRDDEPQPPRQLVGDIPRELERVCLKALAKRQQERYTTAADFGEDLRRVLEMPAPALAAGSSSKEQPQTRLPAAGEGALQLPSARHDLSTPSSCQRRLREAERRQVTVLVCGWDLFESEVYLGLDAEDQAEVLRSFQQACEEAVGRLERTIVQCNEQGLLVCFGYPEAFEDGARRAVRAGLRLLDGLKVFCERLRRQHQLELNVRVGLHTGPAVVEAKDGALSLLGEARNVAVRLGAVAAPGHIVCTEATQRLIRGEFQCAALGTRKLKGVAQPVELFQIQGVGEVPSTIETIAPD
jgi:class 3 adenylate cyclase